MSNTFKALAFALLLIFGASAQAQTQRLPADAYGALPQTEFAAISPDGSKIAFARYDENGAAVFVVDSETGAQVFGANVREGNQLRSVWWIDDQRVGFHLKKTVPVVTMNVRFRGNLARIDLVRVGVANLTTNRMTLLTTDEEHPWSNGVGLTAPIEGDAGYGRMIGSQTPYGPPRLQLYRINLDTNVARVFAVQGLNADTSNIIVDSRGEPAARVDINDETDRWSVYGYVDGAPRLLLQNVSHTGYATTAPAGLLPDGRLALWEQGDETDRLLAIDRATSAQDVIYTRGQGGIECVITDPVTGKVVGVEYFDLTRRQHFFDPQLQLLLGAAEQLVGSDEVRLQSWSRDRSRAVVYFESGLDGGGYYLMQGGALSRIGMRYPRVAEATETGGAERQSITYRARDGVRIPAILTLPGAERHNLPLVVLVHDGPLAHDDLSFNWWSAFLTSRGYAVLQPNFRGSDGYGRAWEEAGRRQWGRLMQTDVEDGAAALVQAGMVDASRVCIMGASYGGYAALAGATLTPDRYRCAVSVAGFSDLDAFVQGRIARFGVESRVGDYWRMSIGDLEEDREAIRAVSPINLVDRVRIPILLIHGNDDTVVPIAQSREMDQRLRRAGKDSRLVVLQRDDHWLSDSATRTQMLSEIETFLAQHLPVSR